MKTFASQAVAAHVPSGKLFIAVPKLMTAHGSSLDLDTGKG
jgi:hypothetical protein